MRKIALTLMALSCVLLCGCSNSSKEALPNGKYLLDGKTDVTTPYVLLLGNNQFEFNYSAYSSYFASGTYKKEDDAFVMTTEDGKYTFVFQTKDGKLAFDLKRSSTIPKINGENPLEDGAEFVLTK